MGWMIVGDSYVNLDHVAKITVEEDEDGVIVTLFASDIVVLEQVVIRKEALQHLYRVLAYLTKAVPLITTTLPQVASGGEDECESS